MQAEDLEPARRLYGETLQLTMLDLCNFLWFAFQILLIRPLWVMKDKSGMKVQYFQGASSQLTLQPFLLLLP
jgi:hypothetical protein